LASIARAEEVLGRVEDAFAHYQQALELCPENKDIRKAAILNNMALVITQQGVRIVQNVSVLGRGARFEAISHYSPC
jgi:tetratricopeptide (TPR) repeat protein